MADRRNPVGVPAGRVLAGVLDEIGAIPASRQEPGLVADALAQARIIDDPESVTVAPAAFAQLMAVLDELHGDGGIG